MLNLAKEEEIMKLLNLTTRRKEKWNVKFSKGRNYETVKFNNQTKRNEGIMNEK